MIKLDLTKHELFSSIKLDESTKDLIERIHSKYNMTWEDSQGIYIERFFDESGNEIGKLVTDIGRGELVSNGQTVIEWIGGILDYYDFEYFVAKKEKQSQYEYNVYDYIFVG